MIDNNWSIKGLCISKISGWNLFSVREVYNDNIPYYCRISSLSSHRQNHVLMKAANKVKFKLGVPISVILVAAHFYPQPHTTLVHLSVQQSCTFSAISVMCLSKVIADWSMSNPQDDCAFVHQTKPLNCWGKPSVCALRLQKASHV